jgi:acyl phosphate:glycerol-3-phosphate acyltransferase
MVGLLASLAAAYAVGSIPSGFLIGRLAGIHDIRRYGSGNVGATNVLRTLGWRPALFVLALDTAKGVAGVLLARSAGGSPAWQAAGGCAAMAGHMWPFTIGFRGGRGVATGLGVTLALDPIAAAVVSVVFVVVVGVSRYVSLGSITAATMSLIVLGLRGASWGQIIVAGLGVSAVIWRHQSNIRRLLTGQESKFSFHGRTGATAPVPTRPIT